VILICGLSAAVLRGASWRSLCVDGWLEDLKGLHLAAANPLGASPSLTAISSGDSSLPRQDKLLGRLNATQ
jgi:hypothetical protein